MKRTSTASFLVAALALSSAVGLRIEAQEMPAPAAGVFTLESATVDSVNAAFDAGTLTSEKLVSLYLARIAAYENAGPNINAFINIHPDPLSVARALDEKRRTKGPRSPLQGIRWC